jgi:uncharacterized membrane protein
MIVPCRVLDAGAPWRWLVAGWRDLRAAPRVTLVFGAAVVVASVGVSALAWRLGRFALLAALLSGFVYFAPLLGAAMYRVSLDRLNGRTPTLAAGIRGARRVLGQAGVFALVQLVVVLVWSRAGMMVTAFVPVEDGDQLALAYYLAIGSAVGTVFALATFASAVVSLPLVAMIEVDMVTACVSSINAVLRNTGVMAMWAALIVVLTAVGFATAFVGLAVVMPWLAYASVHACRETLDTHGWPDADAASGQDPADE